MSRLVCFFFLLGKALFELEEEEEVVLEEEEEEALVGEVLFFPPLPITPLLLATFLAAADAAAVCISFCLPASVSASQSSRLAIAPVVEPLSFVTLSSLMIALAAFSSASSFASPSLSTRLPISISAQFRAYARRLGGYGQALVQKLPCRCFC